MFDLLRGNFSTLYTLLLSKTARNTGIIFVGNILAAALSFFTIALISRTLGPHNFGIFATATTFMATIAGFTDFGLGSALVRFFNSNIEENPNKAKLFVSVIFKTEVAIGLVILVFGMLLVEPAANFLGGENSAEFILPLRLAVVGAFGLSMGAFIPAAFQAYEKFIKLGYFPVLMNGLRLSALLLLFLATQFTLINSLWIYALTPLLGFCLGLFFLNRDFLYNGDSFSEQKKVFFEVFHFAKWIMLSFFANALAGKLDILMLSHFRTSTEVGIYSVAIQIATFFPLFIAAISSVLYPKVSKLDRTRSEFVGYLKKTFGLSFAFLVLFIPLIILAPRLIALIFGELYLEATSIFLILSLGYIVAIFANPITLVIFALDRARYITLVNYIQLGLVFSLNLFLIPRLGNIGAATTFLISTIFGAIILVFYSIYISYKLPEVKQ